MNSHAALRQSYSLMRQGQLKEAEAICRAVVASAPRNAEALHLLGLIRNEANDFAAAERLLEQSIQLEPRRAEFHLNFANVLRRRERWSDAERAFRAALALDPANHTARLGLARTLDSAGRLSAAEMEYRTALGARSADARTWVWLGMNLRSQNKLADAEGAYRLALRVDARYAVAHHNLGSLLSQMEQAEEALATLDRARELGAGGFELAFNYGRVLSQLYRFDEAESAFAQAIAIEPRHAEAHLNLAKLRYMRGDASFARDAIAAAKTHRDVIALQILSGTVLRQAGDLRGAEEKLKEALREHGPSAYLRNSLAGVLHETGRLEEAEREALAAQAAEPLDPVITETLVAILLARGRADAALPFIREQRRARPLEQTWLAYEASAARSLNDARYGELYDYDRFVKSFELAPPRGWSSIGELNAAVIDALNTRHALERHPLDQSLRNGTQTARNLLAESDPAIRDLLQAFAAPIREYLRAIGSDDAHPLRSRNRGEARIVAAWSVRLYRDGFHVNHFHPEGWISSAYYVSTPKEVDDPELKSGWLKFGEPRFPIPGAHPERFVRPQPGLLVLFPSYMWHGTNPIRGKEARMTVAFDVVPNAT